MNYCTDRDADYALACCKLAATRGFPAYLRAGFTWFYGDFECAAYNHAQEPNGRIPDAITKSGWIGIATVRSLHPGGVRGLMADGTVRFFKDSIGAGSGVASAREMAVNWSSDRATTDPVGSPIVTLRSCSVC